MEISMFRSYSDLGRDEHSFIDQQLEQPISLEELFNMPPLSPLLYSNSVHHGTYTNNSIPNSKLSVETDHQRSTKQLKTNDNWSPNNHAVRSLNSNSSTMLSFSSSNNSNNQASLLTPKEETAISTIKNQTYDQPHQSAKRIRSDFDSHPKEHVVAERKRREKLTERFIALSAIVPGLKKTDKASVLGDAAKYLKKLQEQVKTLEEENRRRKTEESAVSAKRSRVFVDDNDQYYSSGQEILCDHDSANYVCPEIEARFSDKDVLIRIHCEKKKGVLEKLIAQIENLHLVVINTSAMVFGNSALEVTIIAQMGAGFSMAAKDLVRNLHSSRTTSST